MKKALVIGSEGNIGAPLVCPLRDVGYDVPGTDLVPGWKRDSTMAGLTPPIMLSLSIVVIAALVGAPGLGVPVRRALNAINVGNGFESGLAIVLLAIILDRFFRVEEKGR